MRHATIRSAATQTSALSRPLRSLTSQPSATSPSGRQRKHALRQDSTPAVCRYAITNGSREVANKKLLADMANMAALATLQTVAQTDSVHVCHMPLADMAAKAMGRGFRRFETQSIREHPPNPRKSAFHSSPSQRLPRE